MTEQSLFVIGCVARYSCIGRVSQYLLYSEDDRKNYLRVVNYHRVRDEDRPAFRAQLQFYSDHFHIVTPQDVAQAYRANKPMTGANILITFDDGLLSQYDTAAPVLDVLGVKAVFFIPTGALRLTEAQRVEFATLNLHFGHLDARNETKFMGVDQLQELAAHGHTLGSHTVSHCKFAEVSDPVRIQAELSESQKTLSDITGRPTTFFAYPKGDRSAASPDAVRATRELFDVSFFALRGRNTHRTPRWYLRRDPVHPYYPLSYVKSCLLGHLDAYYHVRMSAVMRLGGDGDA